MIFPTIRGHINWTEWRLSGPPWGSSRPTSVSDGYELAATKRTFASYRNIRAMKLRGLFESCACYCVSVVGCMRPPNHDGR